MGKGTGRQWNILNSGNRSERINAHKFYLKRGFEGKSTGFVKTLT